MAVRAGEGKDGLNIYLMSFQNQHNKKAKNFMDKLICFFIRGLSLYRLSRSFNSLQTELIRVCRSGGS